MQAKTMTSKTMLQVKAPKTRTQDAMKQDAQKKAPQYPSTDSPQHLGQGTKTQPFVSSKKGVKPFLPAMDAAKYAEYKAQTRKAAGMKKNVAAPAPAKARSPLVQVGANFTGAINVDGESPPDTHGAIGTDEFVEVTNSHINIYPRTDPSSVTSLSLAAFFGYFTQPLFDPRVIYDPTWHRWIVTADAFPESSSVQNFFIALSMTPSAAGPYWIYGLNVTFNNGDFWDFPQLGMNQDAIIITANVFDASGNLRGADMFAVAKARLYNGWGFSVPLFSGLASTLAPPIVLDQRDTAFLIAAPPSGSSLQIYALGDAATEQTLSGPVNVPVPAYDMPPPAPQSGTSDPNNLLDTGDSRFVNASTQAGDSLWQVHTVNLDGFAAPKYYQINTATNTVTQSAFFFASGTSYDFNASIAANSDNDMFVTWSSTDPAAGIDPQLRYSGCDHNDGACFPGAGSVLFTSSVFLSADFDPRFGLQRWGDYSAVTVDPTNSRQAWVVDEAVGSGNDWSSQIGEIGFE